MVTVTPSVLIRLSCPTPVEPERSFLSPRDHAPFAAQAQPADFTGKVVGLSDGDTITVL